MHRRSLTSISIAAFFFAPALLGAQRRDSLWTIKSGAFAGETIHIDSDLATRRGSKFLRVSKLKGDARFVGWNPSHLPAAVAFRGGRGISAEDSIAFWSIVNRLEEDMGMRLFVPATISSSSDPDDVIIIDTKNMANDDGMTFVTWSQSGGVYDARVYFRSTATLHNPRVVTHEMMHTLGFGHTTAWSSVMNPGPWSPIGVTVDDVAYAQFAIEARASSEREDMWERLALANDRESDSKFPTLPAPCPPLSVIGLEQLEPGVLPIADRRRLSPCFR